MAVVAGNLALLLDFISPRSLGTERKIQLVAPELVLNLPKRSDLQLYFAAMSSKSSEPDGESRNPRFVSRGKVNSDFNGVDYDASFSDEDDDVNEAEDEDEAYNWEEEMRKRVKEIQEMEELEKKAEELQSNVDYVDGERREETEDEKRMRVRKELQKVAREQAERRAMAQLMFELGQKAYGKGTYGRAIEFFEGALTIIPSPTLFGGEIQIWLAMAYEANKRHADCITLYLRLETKHPSVIIRRQAAELRYILQAPKLKISQEEMVTIPLIGSSYDRYATSWSDKYRNKEQKRSESATNKLPSSRHSLEDFLVWRPPAGLEKNKGFWVSVTLWLSLVGASVFLKR